TETRVGLPNPYKLLLLGFPRGERRSFSPGTLCGWSLSKEREDIHCHTLATPDSGLLHLITIYCLQLFLGKRQTIK
ncbi:hypothetical protein LEMLEM_LOCUS13615, partial [Lemmus lemmus]